MPAFARVWKGLGSGLRPLGRRGDSRLGMEALEERQLLSVSASNLPEVAAVEEYQVPRHNLQRLGGYLSEPAAGDAGTIAQEYLVAHAAELGVTPWDIRTAEVTDRYTSEQTGVTHIYLRQTLHGLEIVNANMNVNVARDGRILSVGGGFVPGVRAADGTETGVTRAPRLAAVAALRAGAAAAGLGLSREPGVRAAAGANEANQAVTLDAPEASRDPIPARLHYVATGEGVKLAWNLVLNTPDGRHWYDMSVDSGTGAVLRSPDWVNHASYNVYELPNESPNEGSRTVVGEVADPDASPYGWHDTNGVAGPESTLTRGNNVSAQEDRDSNNSGGYQPDGGAGLNFNFPIDFTQDPVSYQDAAIANLFYVNNVIHDVHYQYGFTEAAGNFQVNNYGRGGTGNDAVQADAQDGSGVNNANMATPPEGFSPRMQMFLWNLTSPRRDGDLDNGIIIHEYGHGVSNRLTGGPANSGALSARQSGGMGEGWSDWWALMLTQRSTDTQNAAYPIGTYVLGETSGGSGIRRYPYSYDMSVNPLTFGVYNQSSQVHDAGEIWATILWDMNWNLIQKHGYSSDLYDGTAGNNLAMQLVMDGLKLQPANPSFTDARDAILQADVALTGGANQTEIWRAFARRGMGLSASDGGGATSRTVVEAFDMPIADPVVLSHTPTDSLTPVSSVDFTFNQGMNTASFSVASDVASFTGPGGVNLLPQVTGFSWVNSSTLRVNFNTQSSGGAYTMVIGPQILAADNNAPMDQDQDATPGEATADRYTATFQIVACIGPDGFGYEACPEPYTSLDLVPGATGVVSILNGRQDANTSIPLGTNTFNFYGQSYTGSSQLFVSTNGLITFGSGSSSAANGNLVSLPAPRAIAVLWDDWRTNAAFGGATNDVVLYQFDTANNRLIIEWNNVRRTGHSTSERATFQAILSLNTGATPGDIVLNYPDLALNSVSYDNGASATVGIKGLNSQSTYRLLVSQDSGSGALIGSGKAVRITTNHAADALAGGEAPMMASEAFQLAFALRTRTAAQQASDAVLGGDDDGASLVDLIARGRSRRR